METFKKGKNGENGILAKRANGKKNGKKMAKVCLTLPKKYQKWQKGSETVLVSKAYFPQANCLIELFEMAKFFPRNGQEMDKIKFRQNLPL